jgi:hypothetical protein
MSVEFIPPRAPKHKITTHDQMLIWARLGGVCCPVRESSSLAKP